MSKDWKDITDDELLNFDKAQPAIIGRYERIMAMKVVQSLLEVRGGLHDLKVTMHTVSDRLEERFKKSEELQDRIAKSQGRVQVATFVLTFVIAAATVAYTWITWESVEAQREANAIERQAQLMLSEEPGSNKANQ